MTLLVFGKSGQIATELARRAPGAVFLGRKDADLCDPEGCAAAIHAHAPNAVINAAAYTAVDHAEDDEAVAMRVNADAPGAMAEACAAQGVPLLHISTDYVFDGSGDTAWHPGDGPGPLGVYGRTKLAGERAIVQAGGPHAILRTSWVFSAQGGNFVRTMLRLGRTREALSIVEDQVGGPTPAADIAAACLSISGALRENPGQTGIYHFAGWPDTSWKGFAEAIFGMTGHAVSITGIPTSDYPTPAKRPLNSRLDCRTTEHAFGITRPRWQTGLRDVLKELGDLRQ
ncbi:dTDP-4-dehydrorhamnose reductase [Salibaculum sp.]|uniref:dTDP-4-dehydrorhamnose reductase n=1 Tax=Salibaculum sp. TaxID=2855480 RepID=UPI002B46ECEB|nr:dTDP-4-dehydrorhamnose reductase [Salibaculum sp.]HKL69072.1 dTDP-4-dehydrorhamnose reductase [Salibaculum sp.]